MAGAHGGAVSQPYHQLQPVYVELTARSTTSFEDAALAELLNGERCHQGPGSDAFGTRDAAPRVVPFVIRPMDRAFEALKATGEATADADVEQACAMPRRVALAAALVRALDTRVEALAANGEVELALTHAREAVRMEPYRESGYRRLMRMQARNGDRGEAIRSYLDCKRLLESELGVGPSEETESLYREIAGQAV